MPLFALTCLSWDASSTVCIVSFAQQAVCAHAVAKFVAGAPAIAVPYRQNRLVMFKSSLLHR